MPREPVLRNTCHGPRTSLPQRFPLHRSRPIGWRQDRRPVVSKLPLHSRCAAKMSPHIRICPEPVLTANARSPPAAGSHSLAGSDSAPHSEQNFQVWSRVPYVTCASSAACCRTRVSRAVDAVWLRRIFSSCTDLVYMLVDKFVLIL